MVFDQITLVFDGEEYTVKDGQLWGLAEAVEDVVSLVWLAPRLSHGDVPAGRIFRAYASALKYAGCKDVTAEQISKGVGYKRMIEMAYELAAILTITQPGGDVDLGDPAPERQSEAAKKKRMVGSSEPATTYGSDGGTTRSISGNSTRRNSGGSRKRK